MNLINNKGRYGYHLSLIEACQNCPIDFRLDKIRHQKVPNAIIYNPYQKAVSSYQKCLS